MKEIWNSRYASTEYVYGKEPNQFLKVELPKFPTGKILFPAEGEGRNAVFAAFLGWTVEAFDISEEGKKKALQLANEKQVEINYTISDVAHMPYSAETFDAIAFIYTHFPIEAKHEYYEKMLQCLKNGGLVIFECFSKKQFEFQKIYNSGGPKDLGMLYSREELEKIFQHFDNIYFEEEIIELSEGELHKGKAAVVRFVGRKTA